MIERDRIEVRGLELQLYCGVLPEEQSRTQPFRFDLDIYLDLGPPGRSEELAETVDYGALCMLLAERLGAERFTLLERLAQDTADVVFTHPLVEEVTVTVSKLRPPVPLHLATTGVRIHRQRSS